MAARRDPGGKVGFGNGDAASAETNDGRPFAAGDLPIQMPEAYCGAVSRSLLSHELQFGTP
jgi:hypothetical protein